MNLMQFVGPRENIKLIFGISPLYFLFQILVILLFAGITIFLTRSNILFVSILMVAFSFFLLYRIVGFSTTRYFSTERKLYKKTGLLFRKVNAVELCEVTDMIVKQGVIDRLFQKGHIFINTPGTNSFEIVLKHVWRPYDRKRQVYEFSDECGR